MKVILGCDHGGLAVKAAISEFLRRRGDQVEDLGTNDENSTDYPDYAVPAAQAVVEGRADMAILVCKTGIGMSIAANRYPGIRASVVSDHYSAVMTRCHNDSNVLCLGGRVIGEFMAIDILKGWLDAEYMGGRHDISLGLIRDIEKEIKGETS